MFSDEDRNVQSWGGYFKSASICRDSIKLTEDINWKEVLTQCEGKHRASLPFKAEDSLKEFIQKNEKFVDFIHEFYNK